MYDDNFWVYNDKDEYVVMQVYRLQWFIQDISHSQGHFKIYFPIGTTV